MKRQLILFALAVVLAGFFLTNTQSSNAGSSIRLEALASKTHIHGIAVDSTDPTRLYLATHHGFYVLSADGNATRLSDNGNDYMGFTPHDTRPEEIGMDTVIELCFRRLSEGGGNHNYFWKAKPVRFLDR